MANGYGNMVPFLSNQGGGNWNNQGGGGNWGNQQQQGIHQGFIGNQSSQVYSPAFNVPGYDKSQKQLQGLGFDQAKALTGQRNELLDLLNAQARGEGPSVAQGQLQAATDRNLAQAMGMAASQAGYQPSAAAARNVQNQRAQIGQELANQSGQLRAQEMLSARQQLGDALMQAEQNAQAYAGMGLNQQQAQAAAQMDLQKMLSGNYYKQQEIGAQMSAIQAQREAADKSLWSSIFSDRNLKTNIEDDVDEDIADFLDSLGGL